MHRLSRRWRDPHYHAGFNRLGAWETGSEAQKKVAASACVQQFLLLPDHGIIYAKLKGTSSSYQRRQLIQDTKLAAAFDIADACDEQIRALHGALFPPA